jgi:hypothetical protein
MRGLPSPAPLHFFASRHACAPHALLALCSVFSTFVFSGCATVSAGNSAASLAAASISIIPAEVDFKSVVVGQKNSQTIQITNTSNKNIDLSSLRIGGAGFSLLSAKVPVILAPGGNLSMNIAFAPTSAASENGALTISSPDLKAPVSIPLLGSGEKPVPALQAIPPTINFGSHALNSSAFQSVTLANTGNVPLTLNSVGIVGAGYAITGLTPGVSLSPEQKVEFQVWFHPTASGNSVATLVAGASALTSPLKLAVSGSASATSTSSTASPTPASSHSVTLDWNPSASSVVGYHVYRGGGPSGPYSRITGAMVSALNFKDVDVQSGGHYFYVVTAVGADGVESPFSNEVTADIPNP